MNRPVSRIRCIEGKLKWLKFQKDIKKYRPKIAPRPGAFSTRARPSPGTGHYEYAIEMYLQGFSLDPDAIDAHQELRDFSLKRKASGGRAIGFLDAMKLKRPTSDDRSNMLHAEKLMSYDPGNTDHMQSLLQSAYRGGYWDTVLWIGPIFQTANASDKKPDFAKFILLRDIYKGLKRWHLAADACQYALKLRPQDMDLATELKNLGAMDTMQTAGYERGGSFRDQIRDMNKQAMLLTGDKDYADLDAMAAIIHQAEADYKAEPQRSQQGDEAGRRPRKNRASRFREQGDRYPPGLVTTRPSSSVIASASG